MHRSFFSVITLCVVLSACDAFEDNLSYVCEGSTETRVLANQEVVSSETSRTRKFIVIRDRKIGKSECPTWSQSTIQCQSVDQSQSLSETARAYMLTLDRATGEVTETSDTADGYAIFTGKCMTYKGPNL